MCSAEKFLIYCIYSESQALGKPSTLNIHMEFSYHFGFRHILPYATYIGRSIHCTVYWRDRHVANLRLWKVIYERWWGFRNALGKWGNPCLASLV